MRGSEIACSGARRYGQTGAGKTHTMYGSQVFGKLLLSPAGHLGHRNSPVFVQRNSPVAARGVAIPAMAVLFELIEPPLFERRSAAWNCMGNT